MRYIFLDRGIAQNRVRPVPVLIGGFRSFEDCHRDSLQLCFLAPLRLFPALPKDLKRLALEATWNGGDEKSRRVTNLRIAHREGGLLLDEFADLLNGRIRGPPAAFGNEAPHDVVVDDAECLPQCLYNAADVCF